MRELARRSVRMRPAIRTVSPGVSVTASPRARSSAIACCSVLPGVNAGADHAAAWLLQAVNFWPPLDDGYGWLKANLLDLGQAEVTLE